MRFSAAVRRALSQYAEVRGRARRSEFWWFVLLFVGVYVVGNLVELHTGTGGYLTLLVLLALLTPLVSVTTRRLHDTRHRGTWLLLVLVPVVGWMFLGYWAACDGEQFSNVYGPNPKAQRTGGLVAPTA